MKTQKMRLTQYMRAWESHLYLLELPVSLVTYTLMSYVTVANDVCMAGEDTERMEMIKELNRLGKPARSLYSLSSATSTTGGYGVQAWLFTDNEIYNK